MLVFVYVFFLEFSKKQDLRVFSLKKEKKLYSINNAECAICTATILNVS